MTGAIINDCGAHYKEISFCRKVMAVRSQFLRAARVLHQKRESSTAAANLRVSLQKQLDAIRDAGTWKVERVITSPQAAAITVQEREGHSILNFCANNYLGLSVSLPLPHRSHTNPSSLHPTPISPTSAFETNLIQ